MEVYLHEMNSVHEFKWKKQTLPTIVKHECSFSVSNMCVNKYKVILSALIWVNKDIYRIHVLWLCSITKHLHRLLKMDCEIFDNHEQLKQFEKSCSNKSRYSTSDLAPWQLHICLSIGTNRFTGIVSTVRLLLLLDWIELLSGSTCTLPLLTTASAL